MANPYHDKEGKFTSKGNEGRAEPETKEISSKIKLKTGIDLSNFPKPQEIQPTQNPVNSVNPVNLGAIDTDFELTMPISIEDANAQGNRILGSNSIVNYSKETNLEQTFEMNKGLKAVVTDFPKIFDDNQLLSYGTGIRGNKKFFTYQETKDIIKNIYKREEYDDVRQQLAKSGIDMNAIMHNFINNCVLTENIKPFNFARNKAVGGVTKSIGSKLAGLRTPDAVQINNKNMKHSLKTSIAKMQPSVDMGFFFSWGDKTPTFATSVHELGHHCYNQLQNFITAEEKMKLFDLTVGAQKLQAKGEISGYAATAKEEQIAEAFSDVYCRGDNATNHNKQIVRFFKGVYNRIYGTKQIY